MSFRKHRIISSLIVSVLCGAFIIVYEEILPRNSFADEPQDWLYLSVMMAIVATPLAWLLILLPVSIFVPQRSKLIAWQFCIPIGSIIGTIFSIAFSAIIILGHPFEGISISYFLNFIIPGAACGAICGGAYRQLERRWTKGQSNPQKPTIAP